MTSRCARTKGVPPDRKRAARADRYDAVLAAPFGALGIRLSGDALRDVAFLPPGTPLAAPRSTAAEAVVQQLEAYLRDPHASFALRLEPAGTPFQQRVWAAMRRIPVGSTRTYGDLARELHSASRAVGQACGANPLPVVVPCHRVVAASGIGGFAHETGGFLQGVKRWLLAHESDVARRQGSLLAHAAG